MKTVFAIALLVASAAQAQTYVDGYVRKDGTYVAPHIRSDSNSTKADNYSSQGNTNPYTGQKGTSDPYKPDPSPWSTPAPKKYKY